MEKKSNEIAERKKRQLTEGDKTFSEKQQEDLSIFALFGKLLRALYHNRKHDSFLTAISWIFLGSVVFYSAIYGMMSIITGQFNMFFLIVVNLIGFPLSVFFVFFRTVIYKMFLQTVEGNFPAEYVFSIVSFNNFIILFFAPLIILNLNFASYMTYYWFGLTLILYEVFNMVGLKLITDHKLSKIIVVELLPGIIYGLILFTIIF